MASARLIREVTLRDWEMARARISAGKRFIKNFRSISRDET
jgi:hypothetical protein